MASITERLVAHLQGEGCINDSETDALYRERFHIPDEQDTDLEAVERWAVETAQGANRQEAR